MPVNTPNIVEIVQAVKKNRTMYQIWLTNDAEGVKFPLPLLPERYEVDYGGGIATLDIIGLGELPVIEDRKLVKISFSSRFPAREVPGAMLWKLQPPEDYKDAIAGLERSRYPCHLVITGTNINMHTVITNFKCYEKGGDVGSIYYDITFTEWREVTSREVEVDPITKIAVVPLQETQRADNRQPPTTCQVKEGDSLRKIAKQKLGDENRWEEIYDLNRDQIPHPLFPPIGGVLQMPK